MPDPIITPAFTVHACRGIEGCRHSVIDMPDLPAALAACLAGHDLESELRARVLGPLRHHHRLKISVSLCPNGCSQPQIADIGLLGAAEVRATDTPCSGCRACVDECREGAIELLPSGSVIDRSRCVHCLACARVCPDSVLTQGNSGFRIQLGGKLGRHPMLGRELPGIHSMQDAVRVVDRCVQIFLDRFTPGKRLGDLVQDMNDDQFQTTFLL